MSYIATRLIATQSLADRDATAYDLGLQFWGCVERQLAADASGKFCAVVSYGAQQGDVWDFVIFPVGRDHLIVLPTTGNPLAILASDARNIAYCIFDWIEGDLNWVVSAIEKAIIRTEAATVTA